MTLDEVFIRLSRPQGSLLEGLGAAVRPHLPAGGWPVRLAVPSSGRTELEIELGFASSPPPGADIFEFRRRPGHKADSFLVAFVVPTGIGAELGGHSGDAGAAARLLASACDRLVTHPNVVNAADLNELPENGLYVEGSTLARLLMGTVGLCPTRSNRLLVLLEDHPEPQYLDATLNMLSAARAAAGIEIAEALVLPGRMSMRSVLTPAGRAAGRVEAFEEVDQALEARRGRYDAVALASRVLVPPERHREYFADREDRMVNPWGGVEAILTHAVSLRHGLPAAHAPMMMSSEVHRLEHGPVDPRKGAEPVSVTCLFCVLKGLARSPRLVLDPPAWGAPGLVTAADLGALVIPDGCLGLPTLAALEQGIPVVAVGGTGHRMRNDLDLLPWAPGQLVRVQGYLEAAGALLALRSGVSPESVRRPLAATALTRTCAASVP